MKVAFIPSTFLPYVGGAETQTHNVANCITEKGINIDIYVLKNTEIKNSNYNIINLNYFLISFIFITRYYLNIKLDFLLKRIQDLEEQETAKKS